MIVAIAFAVLVAATAFVAGRRVFARTGGDWLIDGSGLALQGAIAVMFAAAVPHGRINMPMAAQFFVSFVVVDYAFYWNHRLLHGSLWRWHSVHHTARSLDVVVTSRNTLWTPLLMVYIWSAAAAILFLRDPRGWLLGLSLTAALDLWRHSPLTLARAIHRAVSIVLITPHEHAWHHSATQTGVNFGANLSIWDRLHGTYAAPDERPAELGLPLDAGTTARLLMGAR
jgi:sterol desaturase/sphingolipid hydroxylase (fatty acid hydroxylase superfamily)